jgi:hypothetical protein
MDLNYPHIKILHLYIFSLFFMSILSLLPIILSFFIIFPKIFVLNINERKFFECSEFKSDKKKLRQ